MYDVIIVGARVAGASTAMLMARRGLKVLATSRDEAKRARALEIGAHEVFESGARLPMKVDAVMETVGRATWSHSIRARPFPIAPRFCSTSTSTASGAVRTSTPRPGFSKGS